MGALLICIAPSVFGQKKSAYETKKIAIENKYLQQMGVPLSDIAQLRKKGDFFINALFAEKLSLYGKNKGTAQQMALVSKMADELKAAEKLKTAAEIKAEKDKIKKANQRWEEYEERKKEERLREEEERMRLWEQEQKREEEEKEQKIQFYYKKQTDVNKIKQYVKKEFLKWAEKGEFESTNKYQERIQQEGKEKLVKLASNIFFNEFLYRKPYTIKLGTYDADKEIYPISLTKSIHIKAYNTEKEYEEALNGIDHEYKSGSVKISITSDIKMNKENAIALKERTSDDFNFYYEHDVMSILGDSNTDEWIMKDGYLLPISFQFDDNKYFFDKGNYPLLSSLQINTTELGLSEYFPENYTFTLDKNIIKKEMEENGY